MKAVSMRALEAPAMSPEGLRKRGLTVIPGPDSSESGLGHRHATDMATNSRNLQSLQVQDITLSQN